MSLFNSLRSRSSSPRKSPKQASCSKERPTSRDSNAPFLGSVRRRKSDGVIRDLKQICDALAEIEIENATTACLEPETLDQSTTEENGYFSLRGRFPSFNPLRSLRGHPEPRKTIARKKSFLETAAGFFDSMAKTVKEGATYLHKQPQEEDCGQLPESSSRKTLTNGVERQGLERATSSSAPIPIPRAGAPCLEPVEVGPPLSESAFAAASELDRPCLTARPYSTPVLATRVLKKTPSPAKISFEPELPSRASATPRLVPNSKAGEMCQSEDRPGRESPFSLGASPISPALTPPLSWPDSDLIQQYLGTQDVENLEDKNEIRPVEKESDLVERSKKPAMETVDTTRSWIRPGSLAGSEYSARSIEQTSSPSSPTNSDLGDKEVFVGDHPNTASVRPDGGASPVSLVSNLSDESSEGNWEQQNSLMRELARLDKNIQREYLTDSDFGFSNGGSGSTTSLPSCGHSSERNQSTANLSTTAERPTAEEVSEEPSQKPSEKSSESQAQQSTQEMADWIQRPTHEQIRGFLRQHDHSVPFEVIISDRPSGDSKTSRSPPSEASDHQTVQTSPLRSTLTRSCRFVNDGKALPFQHSPAKRPLSLVQEVDKIFQPQENQGIEENRFAVLANLEQSPRTPESSTVLSPSGTNSDHDDCHCRPCRCQGGCNCGNGTACSLRSHSALDAAKGTSAAQTE